MDRLESNRDQEPEEGGDSLYIHMARHDQGKTEYVPFQQTNNTYSPVVWTPRHHAHCQPDLEPATNSKEERDLPVKVVEGAEGLGRRHAGLLM